MFNLVFAKSQNHPSSYRHVENDKDFEGKKSTNLNFAQILALKPVVKLERLSLEHTKLEEIRYQEPFNLCPVLKSEAKFEFKTRGFDNSPVTLFPDVATSIDTNNYLAKLQIGESKAFSAYKCSQVSCAPASKELVQHETKIQNLVPVVTLRRLSSCKPTFNVESYNAGGSSIQPTENIKHGVDNHHLQSIMYIRKRIELGPCKPNEVMGVGTSTFDKACESSVGLDIAESEFPPHTDITSVSDTDEYRNKFADHQLEKKSSKEVSLRDNSYNSSRVSLTKSKQKTVYHTENKDHTMSFSLYKPRNKRRVRSTTHFNCEYCEMVFSIKARLERHLRTHTNIKAYKCDLCDKSFREKYAVKRHLVTHSRVRSTRLFNCEYCEMVFSIKTNLEQHLATHGSIKAYKCDVCGKSFRLKDHVKKHLITHSVIKPHSCDLCGKSFHMRNDLMKHLFIHSNIKAYTCDHCRKSFVSKNYLRDHMRTHKTIKYPCDSCDKSFYSRNGLQYHLKVHANIKPYSCDQCSRSYYSRSNLNHHLSVFHTFLKPFLCNECGKCFAGKYYLSRHMLIHSGNKTIICEYCSKSFRFLSNLRAHMITHTGIGKYSCNHCDKSFSYKSVLEYHVLTHISTKLCM